MPLILAIEPDKRQSAQLTNLVKGLHAELVLRTDAADALGALHGRVPDLVLTTSLISPRDDAALAAHLRELGPAAAHVQTVTIPLLGSAAPKRAKGGMLAALRREKPAPMTDGCAPDVFADQIRQYLATAEEQKVSAATRVLAEAVAEEADAVAEETVGAPEDTIAFEDLAAEPEPVVETPILAEAIEEPAALSIEEPVEAAEIEMAAAAPEAEPLVEPVEEAVVEPEGLLADEPAGLPLSQLLRLVSDAAPIVKAPIVETPFLEAPIVETLFVEAPVVEAPVVEMTADADIAPMAEPVDEAEPQPITSFGDLYVDPMAAQALDELSRHAPMPPVADAIPGEPPVPVVEMRSFQSLDAIASELAAGPAERRESLDDLASLFAATPAASVPPAPADRMTAFSTPMHGEKTLFASLFAEPAPARPPARPIEVPNVDPGLFAPVTAAPVTMFHEPEPVMAVEPEPVLAIEPEPMLAVEPEPTPVVELEPVLAVAPEPTLEEPRLVEAAPAEAAHDETLISFEPVVFEPVVEEPVAAAAAAALDEEIALDVDAFAFTPTEPAAPAEPSRFSFTLVDGFGDAWSDFDVPSIAAVASDLGVGDHPPSDPAARPASAAAASRGAMREPAAAPALDQESLSLIGDAARKLSLDALVIEEFERGIPARRKKAKKKVHAGATAVPPASAPAAAPVPKRPVQDEWGMFDPEQCGFAALDEEEGAEPRPTAGTRVRVISY
jgi:hypothetical protein